MPANLEKAQRYLENWQEERNSAALYHAISEMEEKPQLREIYRRLAVSEETHSHFWEAKLKLVGATVPTQHQPAWRTRTLIFLARRFGPGFVLPRLTSLERSGSHQYDNQPEATEAGLPQQEQSHARLLEAISQKPAKESEIENYAIAQLEGRHRKNDGNALRAAVLGIDDGLVSNLSLVMGVAGADLAEKSVLITGLAGLLAGACSMALGEWLSVQSARELYQHQLEVEKQEIAEVPEEEAEELALIYQAKGLPEKEAKSLAARLIKDQNSALNTRSREDFEGDAEELSGSAWTAAITSFICFAIGAIIPVTAYFFLNGMTAVWVSVALSAVALFGVGSGITLLTGRNALLAGIRQVTFGLIAAAITFGIGKLIGAVIT